MNDLLVGYFIRVLLLEGLHSRHLLRCQLDDGCLLDFQFFLDFQGVLLDQRDCLFLLSHRDLLLHQLEFEFGDLLSHFRFVGRVLRLRLLLSDR